MQQSEEGSWDLHTQDAPRAPASGQGSASAPTPTRRPGVNFGMDFRVDFFGARRHTPAERNCDQKSIWKSAAFFTGGARHPTDTVFFTSFSLPEIRTEIRTEIHTQSFHSVFHTRKSAQKSAQESAQNSHWMFFTTLQCPQQLAHAMGKPTLQGKPSSAPCFPQGWGAKSSASAKASGRRTRSYGGAP